MRYWSALDIINQVSAEVGLARVQTLFDANDVQEVQSSQLLAALQAAGNALVQFYPWEQFKKEWVFTLVAGQGSYPLPDDWDYFIDQTQWDRTNHWPLMGPKNPAEWAWLKGGLIASFPRIRYRVMNNNFEVFPVPTSDTKFEFAMEYVSTDWVQGAGSQKPNQAMVKADGDVVWFHPWLIIKYTKLKWLQLKNFPTDSAAADFQRMWDATLGKDVGAPVLSLVPKQTPFFIGPWSVPDSSWGV